MPGIPVQDFVAQLRCCSAEDFVNIPKIHQLLRDNPVDPKSIERYLNWDRQHYTRNLIEKTALFELLAICWEVGQGSSIHNHKEQNCWMAAPIGRLLVQNYRVLQQDLEAGTCDLDPTDVLEMNASNPCAVDPAQPVHKVFNPIEFNQRAVTLHVYSRPYDSCVVYSDEQHRCGEIKLSYTSEYGLVPK
ncbi:MAG TPA: cysteine dioxygenase family protein [Candidatus Limnocylindrales bacterium]|nr:cysteine dioxygenase family protein [Candidatus Limnocylindrales bacterium]